MDIDKHTDNNTHTEKNAYTQKQNRGHTEKSVVHTPLFLLIFSSSSHSHLELESGLILNLDNLNRGTTHDNVLFHLITLH